MNRTLSLGHFHKLQEFRQPNNSLHSTDALLAEDHTPKEDLEVPQKLHHPRLPGPEVSLGGTPGITRLTSSEWPGPGGCKVAK